MALLAAGGKPPKPKPKPKYNPKGYVYGGASPAVAKAIVKKATIPAKVAPVAKPVAAPAPPVVPGATQIRTTPAPKPFNSYVAEGIPGDWEVQDAEAAFAAQMAKLRNAFTGDIRSALINLGLPENAEIGQQFGGYIDQDTIAKAVQNKYSTAAQIAQQEAAQRANATAALAARGSLRSGATTNRLTGIAAEGEKGRWAAVQDFLSGARGGLTGIANAEEGLLGNIATARSNAAQRLAQQYGWEYPEQSEEADTPAMPGSPAAPAAPAGAAGVKWGGQTFTTKAALSKWLANHGASYASWARSHPAAAKRLR